MRTFLALATLVTLAVTGPVPAVRPEHRPAAPAKSPDPTRVYGRQAAVTPVSDCEWTSDPHGNTPSGCQCSGYEGLLPPLSNQGANSCGYTAVTGSTSYYNTTGLIPQPPQTSGDIGWPCTVTDPNGAIVEYPSTVNGQAGQCAGSSKTVTPGTTVTIGVNTASVLVGTMNGNALYTAVSSALDKACPVPSNTATSCGNVDGIPNVTYLDNNKNQQNNGELAIAVDPAANSYVSNTARLAMIQGIASIMNGSAQSYQAQPQDPNLGNPYAFVPSTPSPVTLFNAASEVQVIFIDAGINQPVQVVQANFQLGVNHGNGGSWSCIGAGLATTAIGVMSMIPGLEWLGVIGGVVGTTVGVECSIIGLEGGIKPS